MIYSALDAYAWNGTHPEDDAPLPRQCQMVTERALAPQGRCQTAELAGLGIEAGGWADQYLIGGNPSKGKAWSQFHRFRLSPNLQSDVWPSTPQVI
jgi:hypothetical protein